MKRNRLDTADTFSNIKKNIEKKGKCYHVGSQMMSSNGIKLPCCSGSPSSCKQETFDILCRYIKLLANKLDQERGNPTKKEKKEKILEELSKPTVVNNYNLTQNNYYNVNIGMSSSTIREIIYKCKNIGASRDQVYKMIMTSLQESNNSKALSIIEINKNGDNTDRALVELDIHNAIVDACQNEDDMQIAEFLAQDEAIVKEHCDKNNVIIEVD